MNNRTLALAIAVSTSLAACTPATYEPPRADVPVVLDGREQGRITDAVIRRDLGTIEGFQQRIKRLNDGGIPVWDYHLAKAQCWVSFALEEYHENDRTGVIEAALVEANGILGSLEAGGRPADGPPRQIATVTRIRPDLWQKLEGLRAAPGAGCAAHVTACLEVKLNEAGHDYGETGWRHARFNIDEAERMAAEAQQLVDACPAPGLPAVPAAVIPAADAPSAGPIAGNEAAGTEILLLGVNFATDSDQLVPESFAVLDAVAASLRANPGLRIEVAGHTDDRASDAYNDALSLRRATTVMEYLRRRGATNLLQARGYGEREPVASNATRDGRLANRRVVLKILD